MSLPHRRIASTVIVLTGLAPVFGGCASIIMPLSAWTAPAAQPAEDITGSIPKTTVAAPPPESDGEAIRRRVEDAVISGTAGAPLEWRNPATGNSGRITALVPTRAKNGATCRDFDTTVATIGGVRLFHGQACQSYAGPSWDLVRLDAGDGSEPLGFAATDIPG